MAGVALTDNFFKKEKWETEITNSSTSTEKIIADYTGLKFPEIYNLPYSEYLLYRHDAWVANMMQSDEGKEFMQTCWRLQQTNADVDAIRKFNEKGGLKHG